MTNRKQRILLCLIILTFIFIWGNSLLHPGASNRLSNMLLRWIRVGVVSVTGTTHRLWLTAPKLRKIMHGTEFMILGILLTITARTFQPRRWYHIPIVTLIGIAAAFTDELIQRFTQRTSQMKDVLIDTGGFLTGLLLVYLIIGLYTLIRKHKSSTPRNSK